MAISTDAQATVDADISSHEDTYRPPLVFDDFYRAHAEAIGRALELTLADRDLAQDATNEAMARALQRWRRVSQFENPAGWVYRVGLNWSLSWLRRRRREREQPLHLGPSTIEMSIEDQELRAAIDSLSVDHRSVVVCRFLLDWSVEQTADALEVPTGTVKSRLSRALDNIRTELEVET